MTSVQVISSAVARINCLKDLVNQSEKISVEAEVLQKDLEGIKKSLLAHSPKTEAGPEFLELEKQVVRLSYEIVDAIADASSFKPKAKETFAMSIIHKMKTGNTKQLAELHTRLTDLHGKLQASTTAGLEIKDQIPEMIMNIKPRKGFLNSKLSISRKGSVDNLKSMMKKEEIQEKSDHPEEKKFSRATPGPASGPSSESKDLVNTIRDELLHNASAPEVYLVGESGMGKTTLAKKLFNDAEVQAFFDKFAWVRITHNFQIKRVLQTLLQQLGPQMDMREMTEIELISRIFAQLDNKKYLIVLDDINSVDDWESIRLALPIANSGRVIITTSANDIGPEKDQYRHNISGLSKTDILGLLEDVTFRSERVGEAVFELSGGSPLFATILGKSLDAKASEQELVDELHSYNVLKGTSKALRACYKRLAPELKPCMLYLSHFPMGQDIDVEKLYLLLVAENLLAQMESKISGSKLPAQVKVSPQFLTEYLDELARLKLVQLHEDAVPTRSGLYKSCRLHDQVRAFCRSKGSEEEFIEIMDFRRPKGEVAPHMRRLAIYVRGERSFINQSITHATLKKLLTLVVFDTSELGDQEKAAGWPSEICDLSEMSRLRILNFDGINFTSRKLPKGLEKLFLLRYLSFRGCLLRELPSSVSSLTQLETLDLTVHPDCEMVIPNNLFTNMTRMVHLYFPRMYKTSSGKTNADVVLMKLQGMTRLEILVNFNTEFCDVGALSELNNLKILSTISRGNLDTQHINFLTGKAEQLQYSSVEITSFDCYDNESVSALKEMLRCRFVHSISVEGRIGELPTEQYGFALTIEEIVLEGSQLMLDPMFYLGKFERLHTLVLSNDAYLGTEMLIGIDSLFPKLRRLKLKKLRFLEKLTIEKNAMPKLSALQIHSCGCLRHLSIPEELDARLKEAQKRDGGDAYSVIPFPSEFVIMSTQ